MLGALVITAVLTVSGLPADAELQRQTVDGQLEAGGAYELEEALPAQTSDALTELGVELDADGIGELNTGELLKALEDTVRETSAAPLAACLSALGSAVLCACAAAMRSGSDTGTSAALETICTIAAGAAVCLPAAGFIDAAASGMESACTFSTTLVPVLAGFAAVSGSGATASTYSVFTLGASEAITALTGTAVVPLVRIFLAVATVSSLVPSLGLERLTGAVERSAKWLLGLLGTVMVGALGVSAVAASAADGASAKTVRFAVGCVPVVGGALGDAVGTVRNCIGIVRSSVGAYGIVAGLFVLLPAVAEAVMWLLCLGVTSWAAQALGAERPAAMMRATASAVSIMLAVMLLIATLFVCTTAIILRIRSG